MRPSRLLAPAIAWLALVLACGWIRHEPVSRSPARRPNLLLVTIDTLRADHVGCFGDAEAETPVLDALAASGVRYEHAIAVAPLTLPSHASLLTGLYPTHHGVRHNGLYRLAPHIETVTERLARVGYETGAVVGSYVLARRFGLAQGFSSYDDAVPGNSSGPGGFPERRAEQVSDRALAWLREASEPFFLWLHYYDPHALYRPPSPFRERFRTHPYDGEVAYVDRELGRVLEALRQSGRLERTLIVVTADHGESLGEHGERDHSYTLYDAVLHVPLIVSGPGLARGRVVSDLVSGVDITPTLLAAAGLDPGSALDGRVLPGLGMGAGATRPPPPSATARPEARLVYSETLAPLLNHGWSPLFAVRSQGYLYVRAPRPELYDLEHDPAEVDNLLEHDPEPWRGLVRRFERELARVGASAQAALPSSAWRLDPAARRRLEALGYALPAAPPQPSGLDPKDGLPLLADLSRATTHYYEGKFDQAERELRRVIGEMPRSPLAHWLLGNLLLQSGRVRQALEEVEAAAALSPRSARYRAMVGEIRRRLGDAAGATAAFRAAEALDPDEPLAQVGLAWAAWRYRDRAGLERHAQRAARAGAPDAMVHLLLGELWMQAAAPDRAARELREALRLRPQARVARMMLATALARMGESTEALRERDRAGPLATDPRLAVALARALARAGASSEAEQVLEAVLHRHPEDEAARRLRSELRAAAPLENGSG